MRFFLAVLLMAVSSGASAATFCVLAGDVAGLDAALQTSEQNGEDDVIQLQAGEYSLSARLVHYSQEPQSLTVEGGFGDFFGNPCGLSPPSPNAAQTRINGNGSASFALVPVGGSLTVSNLTIENAGAVGQSTDAGVELESGGDTWVFNTIFTSNGALHAPGVVIAADNSVQVQNSLFVENYSWSGEPAVELYNTNVISPICNLIINSTFSGNATSAAALSISNLGPDCTSLIANSLFWGNTADDATSFSALTYLLTDDIANFGGQFADSGGVVSIDPLFKDISGGDYSLKDDSPLHDLGTQGGFIWGLGEWDVAGNPRIDGKAPDIGAFEIQDVIFANGIEQ
jgi:hypothetical protein